MQGIYVAQNPSKYIGDSTKIVFRSSYERIFMAWADITYEILAWSSETTHVEYFDPTRNKQRKYIVDFTIQSYNKHGDIKTTLIEVKPFSQSKSTPPKRGRKSDKTYNAEVVTWRTNQAKWNAAKIYAEERGWAFIVLTEKDLLPGGATIKSTFNKKKTK